MGTIVRGLAIGYKEKEIPYVLFQKEERSAALGIILPGTGYTSQAPLLHYAKTVCLEKSYDVLQVNYQYNNHDYDGFKELGEAIKWDVNTVLDEVLSDYAYENFYFIGKSLGTIAMSSVLNKEAFKGAKAVWLTPLIHREDVYEAMANSTHKGLLVIGDKDPCYREERYLKILGNNRITSMLIRDVNHDLEYIGDSLGSINVLKDVIAAIKAF